MAFKNAHHVDNRVSRCIDPQKLAMTHEKDVDISLYQCFCGRCEACIAETLWQCLDIWLNNEHWPRMYGSHLASDL